MSGRFRSLEDLGRAHPPRKYLPKVSHYTCRAHHVPLASDNVCVPAVTLLYMAPSDLWEDTLPFSAVPNDGAHTKLKEKAEDKKERNKDKYVLHSGMVDCSSCPVIPGQGLSSSIEFTCQAPETWSKSHAF